MSDELERLRERVAKLEVEVDLLHALMPPEVGTVGEWRPGEGRIILADSRKRYPENK